MSTNHHTSTNVERSESADPHFVRMKRKCGRCHVEFRTTPLRRYFCKQCWGTVNRLSLDTKEIPAPRKYGRGAGPEY